MPNILAIDTSNNQCSVALNRDGEIKSAVCTQVRQHAKRLLPMIEQILHENSQTLKALDAIAFVNGPGSFTGLRIGAGVAQGLAFGATLPVLALSTLAVMAQKARQQVAAQYFLVAMQAREDEVYFAIYQCSAVDMCLLGKEQVCAPAQITIAEEILQGNCCAVGDGWQQNPLLDKIAGKCTQQIVNCDADAISLSQLAQTRFGTGAALAPEFALPVYLKEQMDY